MFKCKSSQVCVHLYDICDGIDNCPSEDDELLCEVRDVICPKLCSCLNLAISSTKITLELKNIFMPPYVAYHLVSTAMDSISFMKSNTFLSILNVSNNLIVEICSSVSSLLSFH